MSGHLISKETQDRHEKHLGFPLWLIDRGTGKTTACALYQISKSIRMPGQKIRLQDVSIPNSPKRLNEYYACVVKDLVKKLELKGLEVIKSGSEFFIRFNLYEG